MNPLKRGLGVGMLAWMLMLVVPALAQSDVEKRARERGQAVVLEAFGLLSSNLTAALNRGGVSNALQFCSVQATPLTASIAGTNAFTVRRLSHRARNPVNKAGAAELAILDDFRASLAQGKPALPKARTNALGGATFFAPKSAVPELPRPARAGHQAAGPGAAAEAVSERRGHRLLDRRVARPVAGGFSGGSVAGLDEAATVG